MDNRIWTSVVIRSPQWDGQMYESMLSQGFRRSGELFYINICPGCSACVPLRIPVHTFKPSRSQKRVWKKNQDLVVTHEPAAFSVDEFELYRRYSLFKHNTDCSEGEYKKFLIKSPINTEMMKYYEGEKLIALGWIDVLPNSISSVYFAYEPDQSHRSLGTFSVLKEIELGKDLQKSALHLGFWIEGCITMQYKERFNPHQILQNGNWCSHRTKNNI